MWSHAGIRRDGVGLLWALGELDRLAAALSEGPSETRNLLELGRWVVAAALLREESRGAHQRTDFPHTATVARRTLASGPELLLAARARLAERGPAASPAIEAVGR
jgi:L-aspartate oxidase